MARMSDAKLFECRQHIINVLRFPCRDIAMALGLEVRGGRRTGRSGCALHRHAKLCYALRVLAM